MSWVKECGIDIGCETCLVTGIENDRLTREVNEREELAVELAQERARYQREARHWKNVAGLALVSLACLFAVVLILAVNKVL